VQQQTDGGLNVPDLQQALYKSTLSLPTGMQLCSEDRPWSLIRASSYGLDEIFGNNDNPNLELDGSMLDVFLQAHQNNQVFGDIPSKSRNPLATKRVPSPLDSLETASSRKKPRMTSGYRAIISKSTTSSAEIVDGLGIDTADPQEPKKGVRRGPLTPETRQKASHMKTRGACASCYISHVSVSEKPGIRYKVLTSSHSVQMTVHSV